MALSQRQPGRQLVAPHLSSHLPTVDQDGELRERYLEVLRPAVDVHQVVRNSLGVTQPEVELQRLDRS